MKSESIKELATALSKAQSEMHGAKKTAINPFHKNKYATLEDVWDAIREPLTKNGLSVVQTLGFDEKMGPTLTTMLLHSSGEWIEGTRPLHAKSPDPQAIGSAITYARRYDMMALLGICPEDDDGERATAPMRKDPYPQGGYPKPKPQQKHTPQQSSQSDQPWNRNNIHSMEPK